MVRSLVVLLLLAFLGVLAAFNLTTFLAPVPLTLGGPVFHLPLAALLLGVIALISVLFVVWMLRVQGSAMVDMRRQSKELEAQRLLADQAEISRTAELRQFIDIELKRQSAAAAESHAAMLARLDALEQRQLRSLEETGNSLSAYIGELEDRLEHGQNGSMPPPRDPTTLPSRAR